MSNSILIQVRGDTAANWSSKNPILKDREQGYDKTNNVMKVGDGSTAWNSLPSTPEIVDALNSTKTSAALSAAQGKALADRVTTLENKPAGSTVSLINNHTTTTSGTGALDAYQGKVIYDAAVKAATTSSAGQVQLSDSTSGTSTAKAATENAVKKAYDRASTAISNASTAQSRADSAYTLANTANGKIPSGTILTSSNYSSYVSSGISQGVLSVDGYLLSSGSVTVPSGGTWLVICFLDGFKTTSGTISTPSIAVGVVAGGTTITGSNVASYLKSNYVSILNRWYSSSYASDNFSNYVLKNFLFLRVK